VGAPRHSERRDNRLAASVDRGILISGERDAGVQGCGEPQADARSHRLSPTIASERLLPNLSVMRRFALWSIAALLLCLIVAVIGYIHSRDEAIALKARLDALAIDNGKLRTQLADAVKSREAAAGVSQEMKSKASGELPPPPHHRNVQRRESVEMFRNPTTKVLWRKLERRGNMYIYGDLLPMMGLPPDQLSKLLDLMVEQTESGLDANEASKLNNLSDADAAKARQAAENVVAEQIKELIGPNNAAMLQLATSSPGPTAPASVYSEIGVDLSLAGIPLSPGQFDAAAQIYNEVRPYPTFNIGIADDQTPDPATGLTPFYNALLDRLSQILTPAQIAVIKDDYVEQVQFRQYELQQTANHPP
jgi:hypothetical protein